MIRSGNLSEGSPAPPPGEGPPAPPPGEGPPAPPPGEGPPTETIPPPGEGPPTETIPVTGEVMNPLQRAGVLILAGIGASGFIFIILIDLFSFFWTNKPNLPKAPSIPDDYANNAEKLTQYEKAINQYKLLIEEYEKASNIYIKINEAQEDRANKLFEKFILTGILPIFTSVLG